MKFAEQNQENTVTVDVSGVVFGMVLMICSFQIVGNFFFNFTEKNSLQQWIHYTVASSAQLLSKDGKPDSFTSSKADFWRISLKEFWFFLKLN